MKYFAIILGILIIIGAGTLFFFDSLPFVADPSDEDPEVTEIVVEEEPMPVEPDEGIGDSGDEDEEREPIETIGESVGGEDIRAYHFGDGDTEVLLLANAHGGDAPNTAELAEELISHFEDNADAIPENLTVTIIPTMNPDGLESDSRFNENNVDLNRNFDCDWAATSMWRSQEVSGGDEPFSEPEARAIRDYVESEGVDAAIVWFAAEGKVYPSACEGTPSEESVALAATFATAAGYPSEAEFDAYQINGDMVNWMAGENIPAISVLLSNRTGTEFAKNLAGVEAALALIADNE